MKEVKNTKILVNFKVEPEIKAIMVRNAKKYNLSLSAYIVQKCIGNLK